MDAVAAMALGLSLLGGVATTTELVDTKQSPSVFPPIDGPIELVAGGYVQGTGQEFLRPLSPAEQHIWDGLNDVQRTRAALFINNGGTLLSALQSDGGSFALSGM